ncbi:MAG: hypothetical protein WCA46_18940 [Actinocatenispora sp.]
MSDDDLDDGLWQRSRPQVPPVLGWTDPRTGRPMMQYSTVGENSGEENPPTRCPTPTDSLLVEDDEDGGTAEVSF